jgi:hypothetical protein
MQIRSKNIASAWYNCERLNSLIICNPEYSHVGVLGV